MAAREERWIMVRLLRSTQDQLRQWISMQETNYCRGIGKPIRGMANGKVSIDAAVTELLRRDESHRQRSKKSSKNRTFSKFMDDVYIAANPEDPKP